MSRVGYVDKRGNARNRAARRAWMLATFDPELSGQARCRLRLAAACLVIVDAETLSVDRIEPGGSYRRSNIQPACLPCQSKQGGLFAAQTNAWLIDAYRDARDARLALRESDTLAPSSVPGTAGADVTMSQLEQCDFDEHVPAPRFKDWLIEQGAARARTESALYDDQQTG